MENKLKYKTIIILVVLGLSIYFSFPLNKRINLGLDLQGGIHLLMKVDTSKLSGKSKDDARDRAVEVVRNRIDQFGVREPSIVPQGEDEIVVQLPGVTDRDRALDIIGKTAQLEFKLVSKDTEKLKQALDGNIPEGFELKRAKDDGEPLLLEKQAAMTGEYITNAGVRFEQSQFNEPVVTMQFNGEGATKFANITAANVGRRLAVVLDGEVQTAPNIKEAIPSGEAVITGRFAIDKAQDLALVLRVGALPAPMHIEEERTIGPLLGQDSINKGVTAAVIGVALVLIFMAGYYLLAGVLSDIALMMNLLVTLGTLGLLPILFPEFSATLTLPGIAGIALALGMAVDANVLINERIREEVAAGRPMRTAIANGYDRAFSAIFDSNFTTVIGAAFLFIFGTGPIRGFAVTLIIGLCASMFTALTVTRTLFEILLNRGWIKSLPMLHVIKNTKIDFIGLRRIFYVISLVAIVIGLTAFFMKGKSAYGIDFSGGQLQEYSFKTPVPIDQVRLLLKESGFGESSIQQFKENPRVILIKTSTYNSDVVTSKLKAKFPDQDIQVLRIERVGPIAGKHLMDKALAALIWSFVAIMGYVAIRFKHFDFGVAGVIALVHDVLIALGAMVITGRQIDLLSVTAFLTIAGYSINDTIVVYDRIRENMRTMRKASLAEIINVSINQTLSRTILTVFVTLLVVIVIFFYGGEVLSNFAFALLVGFVAGCYSSIFIASPLVLAWSRKSSK